MGLRQQKLLQVKVLMKQRICRAYGRQHNGPS